LAEPAGSVCNACAAPPGVQRTSLIQISRRRPACRAQRAFEQAYGSLRRGGTLVFVALPADNEVKLPIFETVLNGITILGSIVGTRTDLREVFELHKAGKTHVIREVRPLDQVNESIEDAERGPVAARIVFQP
jgi:propanol-preferring alcohol dehydrogenase